MKWCIGVGLSLAVALTGLAYWQSAQAPARAGSHELTSTDLPPDKVTVQGIGYVEPASEVRKLMLRTGGVIRVCHVKAGDRASKGDRLLELDASTHQAEVEVARRGLALARAEADHVRSGVNPYQIRVTEQAVGRLQEKARFYRSEADRSRRLMLSKAASRQDHDVVETQLRQTEAELKEKEAEQLHLRQHVTPEHQAMVEAKVRHAQASLELAQERFRETVLFAPFDGVVLKVLKREGEGVRTFEPEPVVLFGDLCGLKVRAEIDERFVTALAVGQQAVIYGRNLAGKTYRGRLVTLEPIMGDKTVFTRASSERKDLDVLQVLIGMEPGFRAPTGLQVDVRVECPAQGEKATAR